VKIAQFFAALDELAFDDATVFEERGVDIGSSSVIFADVNWCDVSDELSSKLIIDSEQLLM